MSTLRWCAGALAALTLALTGCSSGSAGSSTALKQAMTQVSAGKSARLSFSFGDFARMRASGLLHPNGNPAVAERWISVVGWGADSLIDYAHILPAKIGLNVLAADTAVSTGFGPHAALRLSGHVDAAKVRAKLTALGARPRTFGSTAGLSFGPDNEINTKSPLSQLGLINQLDQVAFTGDSMIASPNSAGVQSMSEVKTSVSDSGDYSAIADCLGDVIAAYIVPAAKSDTNAGLYAVGVLDPGSPNGTDNEVMCLLPRPGRTDALTAAVRKHLVLHSIDAKTNGPLSRYLSKIRISTSGPCVRVSLAVKPSAPAGFVFRAVEQAQLPSWTS